MDTSKLNTSAQTIDSLGFSEIWSGSAYDAQRESLNDVMTKLKQAISDVDKFDQALDLKTKYMEVCNTLSSLYSSRSRCDTETEEGRSSYNYYSSQISSKEVERKELREQIIAILGTFTGINVEVSPMVNLDNGGDLTVLFDVNKLLDIYKNHGTLALNSEGLFSLYDQYADDGTLIMSGEDYVNEQIRIVASQCSNGREAAVNVGLLILQLAADKGVKIKYENPGANGGLNWGQINWNQETKDYTYTEKSGLNPNVVYNQDYNNITQIHEGSDCCAWVSYVVNVGTAEDPGSNNPQGFHWEGVNGLKGFGETIPVTQAQPGDVFIWQNPDHTGMVIQVNENPDKPGTGTIIVAESGGIHSWLSLNEYTFNMSEDGKTFKMGGTSGAFIRDYTDVYNGTQVNHDDWQGYRPDDPANN